MSGEGPTLIQTRTGWSFACPLCNFRRDWLNVQSANTKVAEHMYLKHRVRVFLERKKGTVRPRLIFLGLP